MFEEQAKLHRLCNFIFGGTNLPISLKTKGRREGTRKTNLPFAHERSEPDADHNLFVVPESSRYPQMKESEPESIIILAINGLQAFSG